MFRLILFKRALIITLTVTLICTLCLTVPILKDSATKTSENSVYAADTSINTAGPTLNWIKNYGGSEVDCFRSVVPAVGGGCVAVGSSSSSNGDVPDNTETLKGTKFVIAKFDNNGNKQWLKTYGGTGSDDFYSVVRASDGGYIAAGYTSSTDGDLPADTSTRTGTKFVIAKFDQAGNKVWIRVYGGTGYDTFRSITQAPGGGYIAAGYTSSTDGDLSDDTSTRTGTKFVIAKFDHSGNKKWIKAYGGTGYDVFYSIVSTTGGGCVVAGSSSSSDGDVPAETDTRKGTSFILAKFDSNGDKQWIKAYGGTNHDGFNSVISVPGGGYIAAGQSYSSNGDLPGNKGNYDAIIAKFDKDGNSLWFKNFGGSSVDCFSTVTQASGNCLVAAGYSGSSNGDIPGSKGGYDMIIGKFDKNGNKIWINNYGGSMPDYCRSIMQVPEGGYVAAGSSYSANGDLPGNKGSEDFVLCKITEPFTITLDPNGGNKISPNKKTVIGGGKYGSLPFSTRKGYKFQGWYTEKKSGKKITKDSVVEIINDTTLYANWKGKKYTIKFCDQKGKQLYKKGKKLTKKVTYGKKYGSLQKPRDKSRRYQFLGWYTKKVGGKRIKAESIVKITKTTKLYTHWKRY